MNYGVPLILLDFVQKGVKMSLIYDILHPCLGATGDSRVRGTHGYCVLDPINDSFDTSGQLRGVFSK